MREPGPALSGRSLYVKFNVHPRQAGDSEAVGRLLECAGLPAEVESHVGTWATWCALLQTAFEVPFLIISYISGRDVYRSRKRKPRRVGSSRGWIGVFEHVGARGDADCPSISFR